MVYFWKNLTDKIRRHSWKNLYVWVKVQSDNLYIFWRACLTIHNGFRDFHRHFKFLRSLEFDFWANLTIRLVRNPFFFLSPIKFSAKSEKYIGRKTLIDAYNNFCSKRSVNLKHSKNELEVAWAPRRPASSVRVKSQSLYRKVYSHVEEVNET